MDVEISALTQITTCLREAKYGERVPGPALSACPGPYEKMQGRADFVASYHVLVNVPSWGLECGYFNAKLIVN